MSQAAGVNPAEQLETAHQGLVSRLVRGRAGTSQVRLLRSRTDYTLAAIVIAVAIALPFALGSNFQPPLNLPWSEWPADVNLALIAAVGAVAFNILVGYTGQLSLAHAAFLILGTMVGALFGTIWGWPFIPVIVMAGLIGLFFGVLVGLPSLRVRGVYLLMATLALHFVAVFAYSEFISAHFESGVITFKAPLLPSWLGGAEINGDKAWYWVLLLIAVITILFASNVTRSRFGRAFAAVREDETRAALMGVDVATTKLRAFALSSAMVTLIGAVSAYYIAVRDPTSFTLDTVLNYAVMIVVGGFSSVQGAIFGAFFFYVAPPLIQWLFENGPGVSSISALQTYNSEVDLLIYGVLIIVILIFQPAGIAGIWQSFRRRLGGLRE